jgi:hypothetical protein
MAVPVVVVVALCLLPGSSVYRSLTGVGGERRRPLVCLGAVKPFVYTDGTRVPWRRLAARSLSIPLPRCRWCRGVGWSRLRGSVRL